jgi:ubiquinone/menaquinone biosynthesis C-methylase UbiE
MTTFEFSYLCAKPFLPPLHKKVRRRLLKLAKSHGSVPEVLDVGGRKSHYTIGIPATITISDLPRESEIQKHLALGLNEEIIDKTRKRRSNVDKLLFDDMTSSRLPDNSFHYVISIEVLEHVEEDDRFIAEVYRVLKPGGVFLMTTPNGDHLKIPNPDHKRHYTRQQLHTLLQSRFDDVKVEYAIQGGRFRRLGLRSWSLKHPLRTFLSMTGNFINTVQSAAGRVKSQAAGTHHLVAEAKKRD